MFERDHFGLNPEPMTQHLIGGVAPSRQDLIKMRYLKKRRARLDAERSETRRIKYMNCLAAAFDCGSRFASGIRSAIGHHTLPFSAVRK